MLDTVNSIPALVRVIDWTQLTVFLLSLEMIDWTQLTVFLLSLE